MTPIPKPTPSKAPAATLPTFPVCMGAMAVLVSLIVVGPETAVLAVCSSDVGALVTVDSVALTVVGPEKLVFAERESEVVAVEAVDSVGDTVEGPAVSVLAVRDVS
jgi:hypothetical protein